MAGVDDDGQRTSTPSSTRLLRAGEGILVDGAQVEFDADRRELDGLVPSCFE